MAELVGNEWKYIVQFIFSTVLGVTQKLQTASILDFTQHREIYPMASVPQFESNGNLPPGIHWTSWDEFVSRFDTNSERHKIISGLREAIELLRRAGCRAVYIGGSLVTNKESPNDFDACWDGEGVSPTFLYHLEPALVGSLEEQKARFGGELSRAHAITAFSGKSFLCFLQSDKNNNPKGVIAINLREL